MNLFNLFSTTAYAQAAAGQPPAPSMIEMLVLPMGFLAIMYFLMIRPQRKKQIEHQKLLQGLKKGDEVVTSGGIIGRVKSVAEHVVVLEIGQNGTIKVLKSNVSSSTAALSDAKSTASKPVTAS